MKKIIYTKYSNDRNPQYAVMTTIELENGKKNICKKAMSKEAEEHIKMFGILRPKLEKQYRGSIFKFIKGTYKDKTIEFPFVTGKSLSERLIELFQKSQWDRAFELIELYAAEVKKTGSLHKFQQSKRFHEVFGDVKINEELYSADVCNIDLIFENVICDTEWIVIDYEWTFDFDIPINFVLYRAIHYLFKENNWGINIAEIYKKLEITKEQIEAYTRMEANFQKFIVNNSTPLYQMRDLIGNALIDVGSSITESRENSSRAMLQVFFDRGQGYSEEDSYRLEKKYGKDGAMELEVEIDTDTREIRIDPMRGQGILYIEKIVDQNGRSLKYYHNGKAIGTNLVSFPEYDVQLYIMIPPDGQSKKVILTGTLEWGNAVIEKELNDQVQYYEVKIDGYIRELAVEKQAHENEKIFLMKSNEALEQKNTALKQEKALLEQEKDLLKQQKQFLEEVIHQMKNTKVWKVYEKYGYLKSKVKGRKNEE